MNIKYREVDKKKKVKELFSDSVARTIDEIANEIDAIYNEKEIESIEIDTYTFGRKINISISNSLIHGNLSLIISVPEGNIVKTYSVIVDKQEIKEAILKMCDE